MKLFLHELNIMAIHLAGQAICTPYFAWATGGVKACLKIKRGPSTRLLALAGVGSVLPARCGDAQASPPWPRPKSAAAGPLSIFRLALSAEQRTVGNAFWPSDAATVGVVYNVGNYVASGGCWQPLIGRGKAKQLGQRNRSPMI